MELTPEEENLIRMNRRQKVSGFKPRTWSDEDALAEFYRLYDMAKKHYDQVIASGCNDSDDRHFIFQEVMELLGKDVWKSYNEAVR